MLKLFNFLSSIKLAVILILSLAVFLAVGTIYESKFGTVMAQKHVYHSAYATFLMFLFIVNLFCAVVDRWPWKKHHTGFIITHAGIITIIFGSFITQQRGLDGYLYLPIDSSSNVFSVEETELRVFQTLNSTPLLPLLKESIDLDRNPPEPKNASPSYEYSLVDSDKLRILQYTPRGKREISVTASENPSDGPALEFELQNPQVQVREWIGINNSLPPFYDLGPALVTFLEGSEFPPLPKPRNQIVLLYNKRNKNSLQYAVYSQSHGLQPKKKGQIGLLSEIDTGWMGLKFKITHWYPSALANVHYRNIPYASQENSPFLGPAVEIAIGNKRTWLELDSPREVSGDKLKYFIAYAKKKYDLGFKIHLKKFKMTHYEGSQIPKSYESTVLVDGRQDPVVISMNEPLEHRGFKLYQSSFEKDERGEPTASILSVNYDPGRSVKYIGSILLVLGIATMFYIKPKWTRRKITT